MSDTKPEGIIENGKRGEIEVGRYKGPAGIRSIAGGYEVAYFGRPPANVPCPATVMGEAVTIVKAGTSPTVKTMALLVAVAPSDPTPPAGE